MEVLRIEGLCKRYPAFVLENVSFSMQPGTIMGLIGRNGAGKTTTLKSLLHVVHPDAGKITLLGMDMDTQELAIRKKLGYVSGTAGYYPKKRLRQLADVTRAFYPDWDEAAYQDCLRRFSLDENKRVSELSEGMKVKFQLALALSHRAELLILDEPTSGLDPVSRDELLDVFMQLSREGKAILFSTHITSDLDKCADDIVYIRQGKILAEDTIEDFVQAWRLVQIADETALSARQRAALVGAKPAKHGLTALVCAEDAALFETAAPATLEEIIIHLEKEDASC